MTSELNLFPIRGTLPWYGKISPWLSKISGGVNTAGEIRFACQKVGEGMEIKLLLFRGWSQL